MLLHCERLVKIQVTNITTTYSGIRETDLSIQVST